MVVVACSTPAPPRAANVAAPACAVPEPEALNASELLLERSLYAMRLRRHVFVLRDGRVLVRISRAPVDGGLECRVSRLTASERDALARLADGLCQWPIGPDQQVMDQGRLEFRSWNGIALCKRNEATTSILPTWSGPDWDQPEPPPLPKWGELMTALDALEARVADAPPAR